MKYIFALLLTCLVAAGATITGNIRDVTDGTFNPRVEFWPVSTPYSSGSTNVIGQAKVVQPINGVFSQQLLAGRYLVKFPPTTNYFYIHVPNDANTYTLASAATNVSTVTGIATAPVWGVTGALTNNDTRQIGLSDRLTIGSAATDGRIILTDGDTKSYTATVGSDGWYFSQPVEASSFLGSGANLTSLNGANIQTGTISTNKMDATAYAAFIGGGSDITPFGVSSTNTFYAVNTNAITIASNFLSFNTNIFVIVGCPTSTYNVSWYWSASKDSYTNSAVSGTAFTLNMNGGTFDTLPALTNSGGVLFGCDSQLLDTGTNSGAWYNSSEALVTGMDSYFPTNYSYHARFFGDASAAMGNVLTNNRAASAGDIFLTNRVFANAGFVQMSNDFNLNLNYDYTGANGNTNYILMDKNGISFPSSTTYDRGLFWNGTGGGYIKLGGSYGFLLRADNGIGVECRTDNGVIRMTDDHRLDGIMKLAGQTAGGDRYSTNEYSGMLAFSAFTASGSTVGYAGIRAKNVNPVSLYNVNGENWASTELWLYTLIPPQLTQASGGFRSVNDTNWFLIGVTNSAIVKGLTVASNALSQWPATPRNRGDAMIVNSNGYPYMLLSTNGTGGSTTWTGTNKIGW